MRYSTKVLTVLLSVVAALGLVAAPATATPVPPVGVHQVKQVGPAGAKYTGKWIGHTRSMALNSNGWGYMTIFSGAADGAKHLVSWGVTRNGGIRVQLRKRVKTYGAGVPMRAGTVYYGRLVRSAKGITYMNLGRGSTWCNDARFGYAQECGA
ncbi:hypothetical protein nbrc107696_02790 [Gordonia spumicola]|uniref:Uncharacterized protein n=1 Tax=Gordonia spumicola TaxID=589161 RepID=A0A7I9V3S3_9ACTN|nr:hypothetical protein [Gordonia spumicola]GED99832.1 hypothetical protein nbrc107696_02790 [Gordonia spumicola]